MNMWKNPTILLLVMKIFGWIFVGTTAFYVLLNIGKSDFWENTWKFISIMVIVVVVFAVIILLSYAILALMYGGKYVMMFEMDETSITHRQMKEQAKKGQAVGWLAILAGVASGRPSTAAAGISAATRTSMTTTFKSVRSIKADKPRNVIKIREILSSNQIYVSDEEFDFVYEYIRSRCPRTW